MIAFFVCISGILGVLSSIIILSAAGFVIVVLTVGLAGNSVTGASVATGFALILSAGLNTEIP